MGYRFILPQEIYDQHLEVINHVRFTKREMDVIACILNNQVVKIKIIKGLQFSPNFS